MASTLQNINEDLLGPNGHNVVRLIERLSKIDWFSTVETKKGQTEAEKALSEFSNLLNIDAYKIHWVTKDQITSFFNEISLDESPLWARLRSIPTNIRDTVEEAGRLTVLSYTTDVVPEILYHSAFDGAFREFERHSEFIVKMAVATIMYLFGLACVWETVSDIAACDTNPFIPLIKVFEHGHWPIGMIEDKFYMI